MLLDRVACEAWLKALLLTLDQMTVPLLELLSSTKANQTNNIAYIFNVQKTLLKERMHNIFILFQYQHLQQSFLLQRFTFFSMNNNSIKNNV